MSQKTDVLKSRRYRIEDEKDRHIYLTIALEPEVGTPYEVWITMPDENKRSEQKIKTSMTMIAALFTEAREQGAPYSKMLKAMERCCYVKDAVPSRVVEVLRTECDEKKAAMLEFEAKARREFGAAVDLSSERIEDISRLVSE